VRVTDEEMQLGKTMLERAIEIDPNFVKAYAELSRAYSRVYFIDHTAESLIKAKKYVDRALQIQPGLPEGHIALGFYYYYGFRNYEQALHEFSIAQKTVPNNPDLLVGFAAIQKRQGNLRAALQENKRILELEPRSAATATELGILSVMIGEQANAQRYFDLAISLQPDNSGPYQYKVDAYLKWTGDTKGARSLITKIPDDEGRKEYLQWIEMMDRNYQAALDFLPLGTNTTYENAILAGDCYRLMHKMTKARASYDAARVELEKLLEKDSKNEDLHAAISIAYAGLNRKEEAIREAKAAVELLPISKDAVLGPWAVRNLTIVYVMVGEYEAAIDQIEYLLSIPTGLKSPSIPMLRINPTWDPLRSLARFQKILERYNPPAR
ncbi:hypothetical protein L0152_31625, partial [bacterium]|nr:hypothetical protein [bacterium]